MAGGDSAQGHSSNTEKSKTKTALCKLLTQRKTKPRTSKTRETTSTGDVPPDLFPPSPTRNMFRGYCDPESKTTRITLCCAMTESNSQTPPHSHPFTLSVRDRDSEGSGSVISTRDVASQTVTVTVYAVRPVDEPGSPEGAAALLPRDIKKRNSSETLRSYSQCSLNRAVSYPPSPLKSADDFASSLTTSSSSGMSTIRKDFTQKLPADNIVISKISTGSGTDFLMSAPELKEVNRRSFTQAIFGSKSASDDVATRPRPEPPMDSLARQALLAAQVLHLIPADKARDRNYLQRRVAANALLGPTELEKVLPTREITIFVGTWNMNGQAPPRGMNDFMLPEGLEHVPDVFAIGTQESYPERFEWEVKIQETIGPSHVMLHSAALGTIHLAIFIRRDLLWFCSIAEESSFSVRPGIGFRTKGAVAVAFIIFGTSFLFITAHLTAHQEKVKARVHDVKRIVRSLDLPKNLPLRSRIKSTDVTQNFDYVFWCGDLNFRLAQNRDDVIHWVEEYKFPLQVDLKTDQLTKLITEGTCLSAFEEGPITFPPTYKYDPGTQNFDTSNKNRTPSYTDRILFKGKVGSVSCTAYSSVPGISTSDHKPVWGVYKSGIRPGIDTIPLTAGLFNREVYMEGMKRRAAELGRQRLGLSSVCSIQ